MPTSVSNAASVLLIEPNRTLALQFRELLAKSFSTMPDTMMVDSLQEGVNVLRSREISLVLVDVELSDGTARDAVRLLRAAAPHSAVIAFAPSGNEESLLAAVQAGSHELLHRVLPSTQELTLAVRSAFIRARSPKISTEALQASSPTAILPATVSKLAHDLNNALMSIKGFTDILLARLPAEEGLHCCVEQIKDSCDRASLLTKDLARLSTDALS
jgi:DNA-binding NarL/FixJ family response regulator